MKWRHSFFGLTLCVLISVSGTAFSAKIEIGSGVCDISLQGEIAKGDAGNLQSLIDNRGDANKDERVTLCLNSPGGDYPEGLKIIDVLLRADASGVTTRVLSGAQCDSACALIFMAGAYGYLDDELPRVTSRFLDLGAKSLGFHRPFFSVSEGTYDSKALEISAIAATKSIAQLMKNNEENQFPNSLLIEALSTGRETLFEIDTLDKLGRWDIHLTGFEFTQQVSEDMAYQACMNKSAWRLEKPSKSVQQKVRADFSKRIGGLMFYRFDGFGREGTESCSVATRTHPRLGFHISFDELQLDSVQPIDANSASQISDVMDMSQEYLDEFWMALAPETKLASLRIANSVAKEDETIGNVIDPKLRVTNSAFPPRFRILINRDLDGLLLRQERAFSFDECQQSCSSTKACTSFTFNSWNRMCFLKKESGITYLEPSAHSGVLVSEPQLHRSSEKTIVARFRGKSFPDTAYSIELVLDEVSCQKLCIGEDTCLAYTFENSGRSCKLFKQVNEYQPDSSSDSGVKRQIQ